MKLKAFILMVSIFTLSTASADFLNLNQKKPLTVPQIRKILKLLNKNKTFDVDEINKEVKIKKSVLELLEAEGRVKESPSEEMSICL